MAQLSEENEFSEEIADNSEFQKKESSAVQQEAVSALLGSNFRNLARSAALGVLALIDGSNDPPQIKDAAQDNTKTGSGSEKGKAVESTKPVADTQHNQEVLNMLMNSDSILSKHHRAPTDDSSLKQNITVDSTKSASGGDQVNKEHRAAAQVVTSGIDGAKLVETKHEEIKEHPRIVNMSSIVDIQRDLKETYNATISGAGKVYNCAGQSVSSRSPNLQEVQVVKAALDRFGLVDKKAGLEFVFTQQKIGEGANAVYDNNKIFLSPNWNMMGNLKMKWLQDATTLPYRKDQGEAQETVSAEATILHELGHYMYARSKPDKWSGNDINVAAEYGFKPMKINMGGGVLLDEAIIGKNNELYIKNNGGWRRCDQNGQPYAGQPVLDFHQMAKVAKVPPGSIYWTNLDEAIAECSTNLYIGGLSRANLAKMSPIAYKAAVNADQKNIDAIKGNGWMRRASDGLVVKATPENLLDVQRYNKRLGL